jgi:S1-C subfamily serine protease
VPFQEIDVSRDQRAAQEMQRRSGQLGVPVITAGDDVIVGFDQRRLQQIAQRHAGPPSIGLRVKDDPTQGVLVGGARPGSPAERAGIQFGDVVQLLDGRPVRSVADLEQIARSLSGGRVVELVVTRRGITTRLPLSL